MRPLNHDEQKAISGMIPAASKEADLAVSLIKNETVTIVGYEGKPYRHCYWTEFFHAAMNRMTKEAGLRV